MIMLGLDIDFAFILNRFAESGIGSNRQATKLSFAASTFLTRAYHAKSIWPPLRWRKHDFSGLGAEVQDC